MAKKKRVTKPRSAKKMLEGNVASSQALITEGVTDAEIIVVVLLLVFLYPIGVICMWMLMKTWPLWVKLLISLPILVVLGFILLVIFFVHVLRVQPMQQRYYIHHRMMQIYPKTTLNTSQSSVLSSRFSDARFLLSVIQSDKLKAG